MNAKEIIDQLTKKSYQLLKKNSEYLMQISKMGNIKENPMLDWGNESKRVITETYSYLLNLDLNHLCEFDILQAVEKYEEAEKSFYLFKQLYLSIQ